MTKYSLRRATALLLGAHALMLSAGCAQNEQFLANARKQVLALTSTRPAPPKTPAKTASQLAPRAQTPARLAQGNAQLRVLEAEMVQMVNATRRSKGLSALVTDSLLAETSRAHSWEMWQRNYFAHESPTASLRHPIDRYRAAFRSTPALVAENVYRQWGSPKTISRADVLRAHNALLNSPGHRANILEPSATRIGIGIVTNPNGDLWITQMFSRLMR